MKDFFTAINFSRQTSHTPAIRRMGSHFRNSTEGTTRRLSLVGSEPRQINPEAIKRWHKAGPG
jgi:hypothetical protein